MSKLGELLVQQGKISERDVERALLAQTEMGGLFGQVLVKLGLVSEQDLCQVLSQQLDIPLAEASDFPEEPITLDALSQDFMFSNAVVPVAMDEGSIRFLIGSRVGREHRRLLRFLVGRISADFHPD